PSTNVTRASPGTLARSAESRLSTTIASRHPSASAARTRLLPMNPAPPTTRMRRPARREADVTGASRASRARLAAEGQGLEGLREAEALVPVDRRLDAAPQWRAHVPSEVTRGRRRVEQDRRGVVHAARPHLDVLVETDPERADGGVEELANRDVGAGGD